MSLQTSTPVLDDQELAGAFRTPTSPNTIHLTGLRCRREHSNMRVAWRSTHREYNVCLECRRLYGDEWEGGARYSYRELIRLSIPVALVTSPSFYHGWPIWWLVCHGLSNDDVDVIEEGVRL